MSLFESLKNKFQLRFKNREFASKILAGALEDSLKKIKIDKINDTILILGIPRGGVIVGDIVVSKLPYNCDFDIIIPRKLTAPNNEEIAIGAIMEDGSTFLNSDLMTDLEVDKDYFEKEKVRQLKEVSRRNKIYRGLKEPVNVQGRIVILLDDGAATGATITAAARWIKKHDPKYLIIALPVTSKDIVEALKKECDLVVTGTTPSSSSFKTVGQYYQEFKPVGDEQVIEVIKKRNTNQKY